MKFIFYTIILASLATHIHAQDTLFRNRVYYRNSTVLLEEYDVNDRTTLKKQGYYARYYRNGYPKKKGFYTDGERSGTWNFYNDSGLVTSAYNYTSLSQIFSEPDTLAVFHLKQAGIDTGFYRSYDAPPRFVGNAPELNDFLDQNLRYPIIARERNITGIVIASFMITKDGFASDPRIVRGIGYGCDDEVLRVIPIMPRWLPARKRNADADCRYYMSFTFSNINK